MQALQLGETTMTKPQLMDRAEASGLSNQAIQGSSLEYLCMPVQLWRPRL